MALDGPLINQSNRLFLSGYTIKCNIMYLYNYLDLTFTKCSLSTILPGKVVSFKHAMQVPAREVLLVKAINMHVFLCFFETRKHFSQGDVFV